MQSIIFAWLNLNGFFSFDWLLSWILSVISLRLLLSSSIRIELYVWSSFLVSSIICEFWFFWLFNKVLTDSFIFFNISILLSFSSIALSIFNSSLLFFIKLNIEQDIDLKKYLLEGSVITKYKLIKALYVNDDENDNFLYIDIPESEKKNYIPYIIIYKKL